MLTHHRRLLAFDHWANLEALNAAAPVADRAPKAVRWMAHIAAAKRLWFARVIGGAGPLPVWPTLALDECRAQLTIAHEEWMKHLASLTDANLDRDVAYLDTRGAACSMALADILTHLPLHGHHHRGQVAAVVRDAGGIPPIIDFAHAARQRFV